MPGTEERPSIFFLLFYSRLAESGQVGNKMRSQLAAPRNCYFECDAQYTAAIISRITLYTY